MTPNLVIQNRWTKYDSITVGFSHIFKKWFVSNLAWKNNQVGLSYLLCFLFIKNGVSTMNPICFEKKTKLMTISITKNLWKRLRFFSVSQRLEDLEEEAVY